MPERVAPSRGASLRPEMDLLLSCARTRLTPEIAARIRAAVQKGIDWLALIQLAMRHDVMPLLHRNLQQVCPDALPDYISGPLRARYEAQVAQARRHAEELVRVLAILADRGIHAVPYKGPALAQRLYGDLSLRPFGDLDVLILHRDVPKAQGLIRRLGYEFARQIDADNFAEHLRVNREFQFVGSDGTRLELHWRFASLLVRVKRDPERFLQRLEMIWLAGVQVSSLPLEDYFLILSLHATKHEWKQLKLICDLAEILGRPDLDWNYVLREAHSLGLKRMLAVGALLAKDSLDAALPAELAQGLKTDRTARAMADRIRHGFCEELPEDWLTLAGFSFQFKIRERLRDKASLLCGHLRTKLSPSERDRRFLPMPEFLSSMYYLVKPVRWSWEKWNDR
jgi:Uncharacterised nucleotidyltransferase